MSQTRILRNFIKMTPGTLVGQSRASTPANSRTIGSQRHPPPGTFGGESRVATPAGCMNPIVPVKDQQPCVASGGELVYLQDGYMWHVWTTVGEHLFEPCRYLEAEYLVVAGGGAGKLNQQAAGGGGGGGMQDSDADGLLSFSDAQVITVGAGGLANAPVGTGDYPLMYGGDSSIGSLVVATGGGRGSIQNANSGGDGGSGGGGNSGVNSGNPAGVGGQGVVGQGEDGGDGNTGSASTGRRSGGGGGGAGGPGGTAEADADGGAGDGGPGREWPAGSGNYYAGGGGGGQRATAGGTGGIGGGGNGGDGGFGTAGTPGTGGGGGGCGFTDGGWDGGSGIVIIRYPYP